MRRRRSKSSTGQSTPASISSTQLTPIARGVSETIVGRALKSNGQRDRIVLATKVHFPMDDDEPNASGTSRRHIVEQCDLSLQRLQTDWIDLYQIHRPHSDLAIDETLRALDDLVRSGKVRYIGSSTHAAWQVVESLWVAKELGLNRFISEQPPYHLLDRRIERELVPMALTYGLAIIPWSPLAFGSLSGKYRRGQPRPEGSRLSGEQDTDRWRGSFSDAAFTVIETLSDPRRAERLHTQSVGSGVVFAAAGRNRADHRPANARPPLQLSGFPGRHGHGRGPGDFGRSHSAGRGDRSLLRRRFRAGSVQMVK